MEVSESESVPVFQNDANRCGSAYNLHHAHFIPGFGSGAELRDCSIESVDASGAKFTVQISLHDCTLVERFLRKLHITGGAAVDVLYHHVFNFLIILYHLTFF